jgi:hypothetical protein
MDRLLSYKAYGLGNGLLSYKVRALSALIGEIRSRFGGGGRATILVGRGLGGVVALLAAAASSGTVSVVLCESLASFSLLLESEYYAWPAEAFLPSALRHFDLPPVMRALADSGASVTVLNPVDALRKPLAPADWESARGSSSGAGGDGGIDVRFGLSEAEAVALMAERIQSASETAQG